MIVLGVDPGNKMTAVVLMDISSERIFGRWYMPNYLIKELVARLVNGTANLNSFKDSRVFPENIPLKDRPGKPKKGRYKRVIYDEDIQKALGNNFKEVKYPKPEFLVMEMVTTYSKDIGRTIFETCVWIGIIIEEFCKKMRSRNNYTLITRTQSKRCMTCTMNSGDAQVNAALRDRIGEKGIKSAPGPMFGMCGDLFAAVAVALTFKDFKNEYKAIMGGPKRNDVLKGKLKLNTFWTQFAVDGGEKSMLWDEYHERT